MKTKRSLTPGSSLSVAAFRLQLKELGNRVRVARQARGLTQSELAKIMEISAKTISAIEVGRVEPSITQVQAISAVLEEPIGYFVGESEGFVEAKIDHVAKALEDIRRSIDLVRMKNK